MKHKLTLETMRQDIAQMLQMDASEIQDDDNLMDLGLDSMRAMSLVMKWREAGAAIEFSELIDDLRLVYWWKLVQSAGLH